MEGPRAIESGISSSSTGHLTREHTPTLTSFKSSVSSFINIKLNHHTSSDLSKILSNWRLTVTRAKGSLPESFQFVIRMLRTSSLTIFLTLVGRTALKCIWRANSDLASITPCSVVNEKSSPRLSIPFTRQATGSRVLLRRKIVFVSFLKIEQRKKSY